MGCTRQHWGCTTAGADAGACFEGRNADICPGAIPIGLWLPLCAGTSRVITHDVGQGVCVKNDLLS